MKKLWFRAKRYGWGWVPATWQGWLILIVYIGAMVKAYDFFADALDTLVNPLAFFVPTAFAMTGILIAICYMTGEKPRWRWGGKDMGKTEKV